MNTKPLLRVAALAGAVLLFSCYVYQRAGGQLLEKLGLKQPAPKPVSTDMDLILLSGSKSAIVAEPDQTKVLVIKPGEEKLFYGSKSAVLVDPQSPGVTSTVNPEGQNTGSTTLLPGSKGGVIADPNPSPPPPAPRTLLPGSKSKILFAPDPEPAGQPTQNNVP